MIYLRINTSAYSIPHRVQNKTKLWYYLGPSHCFDLHKCLAPRDNHRSLCPSVSGRHITCHSTFILVGASAKWVTKFPMCKIFLQILIVFCFMWQLVCFVTGIRPYLFKYSANSLISHVHLNFLFLVLFSIFLAVSHFSETIHLCPACNFKTFFLTDTDFFSHTIPLCRPIW